jgi:hypothetical protein
MDIKPNHPPIGVPTKATVKLFNGDSLSVAYTDLHGNEHILNITAQHLVLVVSHGQTDAAMIFRPAAPVTFVPPTK